MIRIVHPHEVAALVLDASVPVDDVAALFGIERPKVKLFTFENAGKFALVAGFDGHDAIARLQEETPEAFHRVQYY